MGSVLCNAWCTNEQIFTEFFKNRPLWYKVIVSHLADCKNLNDIKVPGNKINYTMWVKSQRSIAFLKKVFKTYLHIIVMFYMR